MVIPAEKKTFEFLKMIILLIIAGTAILTLSSVAAGEDISVVGRGPILSSPSSYYIGEEVIFSVPHYETNSTFLFITGPYLPHGGGKLTSPNQMVVSGDPGSFSVVPTDPYFKSRSYFLYTSGLGIGPGSYTVYAVSQPKTRAELDGVKYSTVDVILKKPFITAAIAPSLVAWGQPFNITGFAEGEPEDVQVWIFGDHYLMNAHIPVNPDSSFTLTIEPELSEKFPKGQMYLVIQHPMQNNKHNIMLDGNTIKTIIESPDGTRKEEETFPIRGEGAVQGWDAVQSFFNEFDAPFVDDTYTVIPFFVNNAGITSNVMTEDLGPTSRSALQEMVTPAVTTIPPATGPSTPKTQPAPLQYAPLGAIALVFVITA